MDTDQGLNGLFEDDGPAARKKVDTSDVQGKTLGKYEIGPQIGEGGMGRVYLAKDTSVGRTCVVKVVKFVSEDAKSRQASIARFQREAQAACQVMHPNVAVTFSFEEIGGRHMLVMEHIIGRSLREALQKNDGTFAPISPKKAIQIAVGILKGLEAIHAAKLVHRDLKPGNVMLTHFEDQVKILDFGLGKFTERSGDPALDLTLTQHDIALGSPTYMSPEQTLALPVDARTDIYSVGVMLFLMLTGRPPFVGDWAAVYEMHRKAPIPQITLRGGALLPEGLEDVVRKAMAKTPEGRYASAAEMRAALEAVTFGPRPKIVPKPAPKRSVLPRAILALGVVAALAVGLVLAADEASERPSGPEAVIMTAKAERPAKADGAKASGGISIPPPPPVAATVAQGCELYARGQTTDAIATLTRAIETSPDDAEGYYCLCGSYARLPDARAEGLKACKAYIDHPRKDADRAKEAQFWYRKLRK